MRLFYITYEKFQPLVGKKEVTMEYALGGLSNNIFASSWTYYIPNKEELIDEVYKILEDEQKK